MSTPENNIITPGTDFMALMETYMLGYIFQRIYRFNNISVYISGANSPGEGEVKIIDWATTHITNKNDSLVICGADSDILLQAMMLSEISSISVLQGGSAYSTAFCNITMMLENLSNVANLTNHGGDNGLKQLHPLYQQYLYNKSIIELEKQQQQKVINNNSILSAYTNTIDNHSTTVSNSNNPNILSKSNSSNSTSSTSTSNSSSSSSSAATRQIFNSINNNHHIINHSAGHLDSVPPSFRLDIIILFLLQGNDYLPKMRGVTIERTLGNYDYYCDYYWE
jgi:5'-3' exonuclease